MVKPLNNSIKAENKTDNNGQQLFHVVLKVVGNTTREEKVKGVMIRDEETN